MTFKTSKTAQNLMNAFAGESQARNRYTFYASRAKKEGFLEIADIFLATAANEKEHAGIFFKHLVSHGFEDEMMTVQAMYPVALSGSTTDNLVSAANGELEEWEVLYPKFAEVAREEGFADVARSFSLIADIEKRHEQRYREVYELLIEGKWYKRDEEVIWECAECGHVHIGKMAPTICPVCTHDQSYFRKHKDF